jgi:hypothetical protein
MVSERFGVEASPEWLSDECLSANGWWGSEGCIGLGGSDASALCWIKSRLVDRGFLRAGRLGAEDVRFSVDLHVGFVCLYEPPEMICLLADDTPMELRGGGVARSKIFRTNHEPHAIDRVAIRVAPDRRRA